MNACSGAKVGLTGSMHEPGHSERAPTLVFVPGFMQRAAAWAPVADRVAQRYPSTLLDFETQSLSERVQEIAAAATGAVAVGYSLGGRLVLHAALRHPGRFAALALVGASAGIEDPRERRARRAADESLAAWIECHPIERVVARWESSAVFASQSPELVAAQRAGRLSHDPVKLAALLRSAGQGALAPVWHRLGELELPLLALAGADDRVYADAVRRMAAAIQGARSVLVPGSGHAPQLERPAEVAAALLEFLDEHFSERGLVDRHA